jgi:mRNA-degrading endonuclease HigB of HigAB toxin-antitoxin module
MKRWLRFVSVMAIGVLAGCGPSRDEGLISSTHTELEAANSAIDTMTTALGEYMKAKESTDKDAKETVVAQKKTLRDAADSYRKSAERLQGYYRQAETAALKTPEERKKFREANNSKLAKVAQTIADASENDRKFRVALEEAKTKKYDTDLTEVFKSLQEADLQFASLKPSGGRVR